jgi:hypothetical protein
MTRTELEALILRLHLPDDQRVEVTEWVTADSLRRRDQAARVWFSIEIAKYRRDVDTGDWGYGHGGRYLLEPDASASQVVLRVFKALLAYEEHELREGFLLDGQPVLGPHPVLARWKT